MDSLTHRMAAAAAAGCHFGRWWFMFLFSPATSCGARANMKPSSSAGGRPPNSYAAPLSDLLWCWWSPPLSRFRRRAATLRVPVCLFFFPLPCPARLILVVLRRAGRQTPIPSRTSARNVAPAPWPLTPCQSLDSSKPLFFLPAVLFGRRRRRISAWYLPP